MPPVFGYRPTISRHTLKSGYPVCTDATFNRTGDIKPEAFGVEMEGMRYRYKINSVKAVKDKHGMYIFKCEYVDLGLLKTVLLKFDINRHVWCIG